MRDGLGSTSHCELPVHTGRVVHHRLRADVEIVGDALVGVTTHQLGEDLELTLGELGVGC